MVAAVVKECLRMGCGVCTYRVSTVMQKCGHAYLLVQLRSPDENVPFIAFVANGRYGQTPQGNRPHRLLRFITYRPWDWDWDWDWDWFIAKQA